MTTGTSPWAKRLLVGLGLGSMVGATACAPAIELGAEGADAGDTPVSCSTPAGPEQPITTLDEAYAAIEGRWRVCTHPFTLGPADVIGIQYGPGSTAPTGDGVTVGGLMYYLVDGPSGPTPGEGFAYQLTYNIGVVDGTAFQLDMKSSLGAFGGGFIYSPSPRELELDNDTSVLTVLLVAL
jgi:hypothetical protein